MALSAEIPKTIQEAAVRLNVLDEARERQHSMPEDCFSGLEHVLVGGSEILHPASNPNISIYLASHTAPLVYAQYPEALKEPIGVLEGRRTIESANIERRRQGSFDGAFSIFDRAIYQGVIRGGKLVMVLGLREVDAAGLVSGVDIGFKRGPDHLKTSALKVYKQMLGQKIVNPYYTSILELESVDDEAIRFRFAQ